MIDAFAGVTLIDDNAGAVIVPPVPDRLMPSPAPEPPAALLIAIFVLFTPAASETLTVAIVPFGIRSVFIPETTQEYAPEAAAQLSVLAAPVVAAPGLAEMDSTDPAGYVNVHCTVVGALPEDDAKLRFSGVVPGIKVKESICPKTGNDDATTTIAITRTKPKHLE